MAQLAEEASKHEGRRIEQTLSILDLEGAGVWVHLNSYAREFFYNFVRNCTELLPREARQAGGDQRAARLPDGLELREAPPRPQHAEQDHNALLLPPNESTLGAHRPHLHPEEVRWAVRLRGEGMFHQPQPHRFCGCTQIR